MGKWSWPLTHVAGPYATADAAFDATERDRDYAHDYGGCTLSYVNEQGKESVVQHDRQANDYGYWHERRRTEIHPYSGREEAAAQRGREARE